jgi:hypothetical protein
MVLLRATALALGLVSTGLYAQASDSWDWKIAPYLWGVNIEGALSVGELSQDLDVSFSDILSDMEVGGSIYAELGKGRHAFHFDYTYLRLKPEPTPLPAPPYPGDSTLSSKMTTRIFETAYHYRFGDAENLALVLGARYLDIEMRLTPNVGTAAPPVDPNVEPPFQREPLSAGPSWWDGFVGLKTSHRLGEKWDFNFYGTVGAGGSDFPWTLQAIFGRRFSNDNRLGLGLRMWGIDYTGNKGRIAELVRIDTTFSGFVVGYEFN